MHVLSLRHFLDFKEQSQQLGTQQSVLVTQSVFIRRGIDDR